MRFKVMQRYGRGPEKEVGVFKTLDEAKTFLDKKVQSDAAMKLNVVYSLYDFDDKIDEKDVSKIDVSRLSPMSQSDGSESGGAGKGSSFRPTPLATSLKPKGMPTHWKDEEEGDKKK